MRGDLILFILMTFYHVAAPFEYGARRENDVQSLQLESVIPPYVPIHRFNITHGRNDVENYYTYVKVDTLTLAANDPNIIFDPERNVLTFFIRYPLYTTSFLVKGYSMPLKTFTGSPEPSSNITTSFPIIPDHELTLPTDLPEHTYKYGRKRN